MFSKELKLFHLVSDTKPSSTTSCFNCVYFNIWLSFFVEWRMRKDLSVTSCLSVWGKKSRLWYVIICLSNAGLPKGLLAFNGHCKNVCRTKQTANIFQTDGHVYVLIYSRNLIFLVRFDTILVCLTDVYTQTSCTTLLKCVEGYLGSRLAWVVWSHQAAEKWNKEHIHIAWMTLSTCMQTEGTSTSPGFTQTHVDLSVLGAVI